MLGESLAAQCAHFCVRGLMAFTTCCALGQGAPGLNLSLDGTDSVLSWNASPHTWSLASADILPALSINWSVITAPVTVVGDSNRIVQSRTKASQYYILEKRGAVVPFTTYEAEDNFTTGGTIALTNSPTSVTWTPELEASGRAFVQLNTTGDYLEFSNVVAANTIVIRHCIPDAPAGGGLSATLSLYVNGIKRQDLLLSSTNNWLYQSAGTNSSENGQSNIPTNGPAHVFWDESRYFISNGVAAGDTIRLQKDAGDIAAYYRIDLIDLEDAPAALAPPAAGTYLNVTSYGANGTDSLDDTTAIKNCIAAAKAAGKIVWVPPGTYLQNASILVDGVIIQGAGMWHTSMIQTQNGTRNFSITGNAPKILDLFIANSATTYRANGGYGISLASPCNNWVVQNVWITHTAAGMWMSGGEDGTIRGCRVRLTYADAINLNKGASRCVVEHNHVRGAGDDGIAILADTSAGYPSTNNTLRYNTVIANWWGHNCSLSGGSGHVVEYNYLADNSHSGCFTVNLNSTYPHYPLTGGVVQRNTILRGGSNFVGQKRGAMWISASAAAITNVFIRDNSILGSLFPAIHLVGNDPQAITFERNVVDAPGTEGFRINSEVIGSCSFLSNIVRNPKPGFNQYTNLAGTNFVGTFNGNTWP